LAAATFVWHEWLSGEVRAGAAVALAVVWTLAWLEGRADWRRLLAEFAAGQTDAVDPVERNDRWFRQAQAAYLAGDWVSAERTLLELLSHDARDAEARLALATLWRHEGRTDAASAELDRLERLETAAPWRREIAWERERIRAKCVEQEAAGEPAAAMAPDSPSLLINPPQTLTPPTEAEPQAESLAPTVEQTPRSRAA
jgi:hypothetical protein